MPHKSDVHVTQQGERDKWAVNEEGSQQASCTHRTQSAAIDSGRAQAKRNRAELLVHGRNGRIRLKRTYAPDPRRSKGLARPNKPSGSSAAAQLVRRRAPRGCYEEPEAQLRAVGSCLTAALVTPFR